MDELILVESHISFKDYKKSSWFIILKRGKGFNSATNSRAFLFLVFCERLLMVFMGSEYLIGYEPVFLILLMKAMQQFEFEDELLRIKTTSENLCSCMEIKYNAFSGVYEVGEAFYWIFGENQIYIITKRNNDMDVINRLREFLTMKAGKKFSICS